MLEPKHTYEPIDEHDAPIGTVHHGIVEHRRGISVARMREEEGPFELLTAIIPIEHIQGLNMMQFVRWYIRPDGAVVVQQWSGIPGKFHAVESEQTESVVG